MRDLYELALRDEAHVVTASRGDEALALARAVPLDAVILDVNMPGLDGWEVCRALKAHNDTASIPVILLTGNDREDVQTRALAVGASAVLKKPCSAEKLLSTIGAVCRTRSAQVSASTGGFRAYYP